MTEKDAISVALSKFSAQHNLNMHIRFYNDHKRLVANQISDIEKKLECDSLDPKRKQDLEIVVSRSFCKLSRLRCWV